MQRRNRAVLLLSYYFPPSGGSGVLRIVRLIHNMPSLGWKPCIITIDSRDLDKMAYGTVHVDQSYAGIGENMAVLRVRSRRPSLMLSCIGRAAMRALRWIRSRAVRLSPFPRALAGDGRAHPAGRPRVEQATAATRQDGSGRSRASGGIQGLLFEMTIIMDQLLEWSVPAIVRGVPFARRCGSSSIFSSSPPWSVHVIALLLKRLCKHRWVMDLRDPICGIEREDRGSSRAKPIRAFYESLERFLIRNADVVVCNCEEIREYYRRRYANTRFEVVMNSYDENDFPAGLRDRDGSCGDTISIRHIGELYATIRTPDAFLRAVSELVLEEPQLKSRLSVSFVGDVHYVGSSEFRNLCAALQVEEIVRAEGYIPHHAAIAAMRDADALLLLQPHESTRYQIPAKLFEYIATGNPVVAIAPAGSATHNIMRRFGLGAVNDPRDIEGIKRSLRDAILGAIPIPPRETVEKFSSRGMAKKLVDIFESLSYRV